jgi:hypothetical protein
MTDSHSSGTHGEGRGKVQHANGEVSTWPASSHASHDCRQSKTLQQAVAEYKKRYKLDPPLGFDAWFRFCQENDVKFIDDVSLPYARGDVVLIQI